MESRKFPVPKLVIVPAPENIVHAYVCGKHPPVEVTDSRMRSPVQAEVPPVMVLSTSGGTTVLIVSLAVSIQEPLTILTL